MTENGKPKYFTLMEELKEKIISGEITVPTMIDEVK